MEGEADEELVSGGEGGSLVHGTLLLTSDDRALLFSPDLDLKAKDYLDLHLSHILGVIHIFGFQKNVLKFEF